jgi:hypothetical protein
LNNTDFNIAAATVIPVLFLALTLQGRLWAWIADRIKASSNMTVLARMVVSLLQFFSIIILAAGSVSEMLAMYALWRQRTDSVIEGTIFFSMLFMIILLGVALASSVPGLFWTNPRTLSLELESGDEKIRWEGTAARLAVALVPWVGGKLFVTDRRLIWKTSSELGLFGARGVEIPSKDLKDIAYQPEPQLHDRLLRSPPVKFITITFLPGSIPFNSFFKVTTKDGRSFNFGVLADDHETIVNFVRDLVRSPTRGL